MTTNSSPEYSPVSSPVGSLISSPVTLLKSSISSNIKQQRNIVLRGASLVVLGAIARRVAAVRAVLGGERAAARARRTTAVHGLATFVDCCSCSLNCLTSVCYNFTIVHAYGVYD